MREEDRQLFRNAVRDVQPLAVEPRRVAEQTRRRPRPEARFAKADRLEVLAESLADLRQPLAPVIESGEELLYRRDGVQETVFRKLRSGQYRVEAELDLHGLTVDQAGQALSEFVAAALVAQYRVLRIVHGKGRRSGHRGPVLKRLVNGYLRRVDAVLAFASAREVDGGVGASLVLLANLRKSR
jgi:DNA-nicking Smr family endonuclease